MQATPCEHRGRQDEQLELNLSRYTALPPPPRCARTAQQRLVSDNICSPCLVTASLPNEPFFSCLLMMSITSTSKSLSSARRVHNTESQDPAFAFFDLTERPFLIGAISLHLFNVSHPESIEIVLYVGTSQTFSSHSFMGACTFVLWTHLAILPVPFTAVLLIETLSLQTNGNL